MSKKTRVKLDKIGPEADSGDGSIALNIDFNQSNQQKIFEALGIFLASIMTAEERLEFLRQMEQERKRITP